MLFQNKCLRIYLFFLCIVSVAASCKHKSYTSPQNYQIGNPQRTLLGKVLNEISGICYNKDDNNLLAVSDSKEKVYLLDLKNIKIKEHTDKIVGSDSDLEDMVKVDTSLFLLMAKGIIKEVPYKAADSAGVKTYTLGLPGSNDFETIYYDPTANGLILICKTCAHEKGEGIRTAYRFDLPSRTFDSTVFFTISKDDIKSIMKNADAKFDPSGAAINPMNKRLYILSSAGNLLVVTDTRGKVAEAYQLNPDDFPQAEGIAFAPNGDMFIANEGKYGKPTLLRFPYQQNGKKK